MAIVTLRLTPRPAHVRTARLVASAMARRCGVADEHLDDVRLAVGEACARAVRLHERYAVDIPVDVELRDGLEFSVVVTDQIGGTVGGRPSTADQGEYLPHWADPDTLGLAVLDGVVEDLQVSSNGSGTEVVMTWPAEPESPPPSDREARPTP